MNILIVILFTVALLGLAFAGIAIKMFFKKDGQFEKKSCCSTNGNSSASCACNRNLIS